MLKQTKTRIRLQAEMGEKVLVRMETIARVYGSN
jgi:hypothetical protein